MSTIKTTEDGWGCVPALREVVEHLGYTADAVYEIKNCVRARSLDSMVDDIKTHLMDAIEALDEIDTTEDFITVEEEEDYND